MGNLTGENFHSNITGQIKARQKVYGMSHRFPKFIQYTNGNSAWIKMSSAIDIKNAGSDPAKQYVLFGGTAMESGSSLRKGFENTYTLGTDKEGSTGQGFRPMPGITSFETKNKNRGSLREATVNIKCFNTEQFQIIDQLYLRLGYGVLVEWGHSLWLDNSGQVNEFSEEMCLTSNFLNGTYNKSPKKLRKDIHDRRLSTFGNYDALYAKIVNFSWEYKSDGSYEITLKLITWGDVIETFKVNQPASDKKGSATESTIEQEKEDTEEVQNASYDSDVIHYARNLNSMANVFYNMKMEMVFNSRQTVSKYNNDAPMYISTNAKSYGFEKNTDFVWFWEYTNLDEQRYYVRLGGLLHWLNTSQNLFTGGKDGEPLITIDNDVESNLIFTTSNVIPSDPRILMFKSMVTMATGEEYKFFQGADQYRVHLEGGTQGQIMNTYFNAAWLIKALIEIKDEKGNSSLIDFLKKICEGINTSLGGLNQLEPVIDETENRIYLVDETVLPNRDKIIKKFNPSSPSETAKFEVSGYKKDNSTFVTDLGIKTEITPELAKMLTIGAQVGGLAMGEDATAFSKWNEGFTDRVMPDKTDRLGTNSNSTKELIENFVNIEKEYSNVLVRLSSLKYDEFVDNFPEVINSFLSQQQAIESITKSSASTTIGFIPVNLNLTFSGLSGMKIYQKFSINNYFLPSNYPETIDFLAKGISHKIEGNKWSTTLESLSVPSSNVSTKASDRKLTFYTPPTDPTNSNLPAPNDGPPSTEDKKKANMGLAGIQKGKCLTKSQPITSGTQCKPTITKSEAKDTLDLRSAALQAAYDATFSNGEYISGYCGKYTYNHAYNYTRALKGEKLAYGGSLSAGGNANQTGYFANLIKLGYTMNVVGKNITQDELMSYLKGENYFLGDVVVYWANDKPKETSSIYGHTQMYIGKGYITEKKSKKGAPAGWTTDVFTNYGSNFVYRRRGHNCWNLLHFRAPIPYVKKEEPKVDLFVSRKIYLDYIEVIDKAYNGTDNYRNGVPLMKDLKGTFDDWEHSMATRLAELFGLDGFTDDHSWTNKFPLDKLNPYHKFMFSQQLRELVLLVSKGSGSMKFYFPYSEDPFWLADHDGLKNYYESNGIDYNKKATRLDLLINPVEYKTFYGNW